MTTRIASFAALPVALLSALLTLVPARSAWSQSTAPATPAASKPDTAAPKQPDKPKPPAGGTSSPEKTTPSPASIKDLLVATDRANIVIPYGENTTSLSLRLMNLAGSERGFRVELVRPSAVGGDVAAAATFSENGNDWAEVTIPANSAKTLKVQVSGALYLGKYEGVVSVTTLAAPVSELRVPLTVTRASSAFGLTFSGPALVNNVLTLKPKSENDKAFSFVVENPKSNPEALLKVGWSAEFSGGRMPVDFVVTPSNPFRLLPGAAQTIQIKASGALPPSGEFSGRMDFSDALSGQSRSLDVRLEPSFIPRRHAALIVLLVAIGAILSAVVGTVVPYLTGRSKLRTRMSELRETLSALPSTEQYAKSNLLRGLYRLDGEILDTRWYTPSASDRLADFAKRATEIEERVQLLAVVAETRADVRASGQVPASARSGLLKELDAVAYDIAKSSTSTANERLAGVRKNIAASREPAAIRATLETTVEELKGTDSLQLDSDGAKRMRARLDRLRAAYDAAKDKGTTERLLELDYEAQCCKIYFLRYWTQIMANRSEAEFLTCEADLLEALNKGQSHLIDLLALVNSLELGVTRQALEKAIADLPGNAIVITSPEVPSPGELVTFRLLFKNAALNSSPLLAEKNIRWTFDHGATEAYGASVGQYFRKTLRSIFTRKRVAYTVTLGTDSGQTISGELQLAKRSLFGEFVGRAEVLSFVITLAGAVVLAFLSKAAEMRPLETVQDYVNPFLWGFGLDRMKSLISARSA